MKKVFLVVLCVCLGAFLGFGCETLNTDKIKGAVDAAVDAVSGGDDDADGSGGGGDEERPAQVPSGAIKAVGVKGKGSYNHNANLLIDRKIPNQAANWQDDRCVWWKGEGAVFTIDLGQVYEIQDVLVQVDNNDDYKLEYSTNDKLYRLLFRINRKDGEVTWGMDTMATMSGNPDYVGGLSFKPVKARYIRVYAQGGDKNYAISEIMVYGR